LHLDEQGPCANTGFQFMDSRHKFKIAAIQARIESCEVERRRLLKMLAGSQIDLAWISERMDSIARDLRFLYRDLEALVKRSEENGTD